MQVTRTITLPHSEAIDMKNWRVGDTLVIGGVRLPFGETALGTRPLTGVMTSEYIDVLTIRGLLGNKHAHIERQITEPWYAEAVRQGWMHTDGLEGIQCLSRTRGLTTAYIRASGFFVYFQGGDREAWFATLEHVLAFATPYHMETT